MKLIIFDMDGTLVDTGNVITNTINFVRQNLGLDIMEKEYLLKHVNDPHINAAEFFYGTEYFTDEQTKLFTDYYDKNCISDIELYKGIEKLLKDIKNQYKLSVATNASTNFANKILEHTAISKYFDFVIGADMVKNAKPDPEMIIKTLHKFDTHKNNSLLIGDSHKDKMAAHGAGIDSVMVNWGFTDHEDDAVKDVQELYNLLSINC